MKFGVRVVIVATLAPTFAWSAPDEDVLGKAQGYPTCPLGRTASEQHCLVGNLSHSDELRPARKVEKGPTVHPLKAGDRAPALRYYYEGRVGTVDSFLERNRNTGLLILQGDTVIAERYQYERRPEHRFQSYSMAKTVVALLVGIAIEEKKIGSIDDLVQQYVPQLKGQPYGETKLRDLLTMSSGMGLADRTEVSTPMFQRSLFLEGPGGADSVQGFNARAAPAGTRFQYSSTDSQVLAVALRAAIGRPLADYLSEKIWRPMGAEADATWNVDGGGHELGYMGINATLRDWGRLGLLLANDGALEGRQIVPAAWLRAMTTPESDRMKPGLLGKHLGYGYQTWLLPPTERESRPQFRLWGVHGQGIYVDPATKLVIVHTAVVREAPDPVPEQYFLFRGVLNSLKTL